MPSIPLTSPYSYLGVFLFLIGGFLILSGLNIIKIEKVTVAAGRATLTMGIIACLFGGLFLILDQIPARTEGDANQPQSSMSQIAGANVTLTTGAQPSASLTELPAPEATYTPTPIINYLPTYQSMQVTIAEDFSSNENKWPDHDVDNDYVTGFRKFVDETYQFKARSKQCCTYRAVNFVLQDFWYNLDASLIEADANPSYTAIVLSIRDNSWYRYYMVYYYLDGYFMVEKSTERNELTRLIDRTYHPAIVIEPGKTNRLGILAEGSKYTFFFNGETIASFEDSSYLSPGGIGFGIDVERADDLLHVQFDNLEIREP